MQLSTITSDNDNDAITVEITRHVNYTLSRDIQEIYFYFHSNAYISILLDHNCKISLLMKVTVV